ERRQAPPGLAAHTHALRVGGEERVAVGTDGDEERMAEGELARLTHQEGQAESADHGGEAEDPHLPPEGVEGEGRDDCGGHQGDPGNRRGPQGTRRVRHGLPPWYRTGRWGARAGPPPSRRRA